MPLKAEDRWEDWLLKKFEQEETAWQHHPGNNEKQAVASERERLLYEMELMKRRLETLG